MHIGRKRNQSSKILEESVENYLVAQIKRIFGICIKLNPNWYKGIPDRLCVFRVGTGHNSYIVIAFVELKRPKGGRLSVTQKVWKKMLTDAGAEWHMINTREQVDQFIRGEL